MLQSTATKPLSWPNRSPGSLSKKAGKNIVGLGLAGNEAQYSAKPFLPILKEARQAGLLLTMHAGEWGGAANVREAIELFNARRIGHGVRVLEDDFTTALARETGTVFEVCMTSNYQTGVVREVNTHPAPKMINAGLNVTFNTDDPSISQITLGNEYRLAVQDLKIPFATLQERILAAASAGFLPENEKIKLVQNLKKEMKLN